MSRGKLNHNEEVRGGRGASGGLDLCRFGQCRLAASQHELDDLLDHDEAAGQHQAHQPLAAGERGRVEDPVEDVELGGQDDRDERAAVERELPAVRRRCRG